jgi:hypothetical protein
MSLAPTNGAVRGQDKHKRKTSWRKKITSGRKKKVCDDKAYLFDREIEDMYTLCLILFKIGVTLLMFNLSGFVPL